MIDFEGVSVVYDDAPRPALGGVDLHVPEGEFCLVVGTTGSGKSTLLRAVNGLVPHFTGGTLSGRVTVDGRDTRDHPPRELADVVGFVGQDPDAGFVADVVEEELAYGMESLGLAPPVMRRRVEETLDLLGLAELRDRPLATLSGGQRQRVAIGAALAAHPRVLVLDEPTSALDPGAAEEVLGALHRLVHDLAVTVLLAEHRLERVVQYADRVVWLPGDGRPPVVGAPGEVLRRSPVAPPVVRLGEAAGWDPPPVTVRDARRHAPALRTRLSGWARPVPSPPGPPVLRARDVTVRYPDVEAVAGVDLAVAPRERVALMGRNGSGKSSLLWAVQGSGPRHGGRVLVDGAAGASGDRHGGAAGGNGGAAGAVDPADLGPARRRRLVGLVPQEPADLLYLRSVDDECAAADVTAAAPGACRRLLDRIAPGIAGETDPRDLSEGQRLSLVLAITLAAAPRVLLLDEPTRGLDYPGKEALADALRGLSDDGVALVLATHDVEFVAQVATRVVLLAGGEVVADGPVAAVVTSSPVFAPQVVKVLAPVPALTVADVRDALATVGAG